MRRGEALSPVEMPWPGNSSATVRMPFSSNFEASGRNCVVRPRQPCNASTSGPCSPQLRAQSRAQLDLAAGRAGRELPGLGRVLPARA